MDGGTSRWWPDNYSIAIVDSERAVAGSKLQFSEVGVLAKQYGGHYRGWIGTPLNADAADVHFAPTAIILTCAFSPC